MFYALLVSRYQVSVYRTNGPLVCTWTINVVKTKALISCRVTTRLICAFIFAYAKSRFSHDAAYKTA